MRSIKQTPAFGKAFPLFLVTGLFFSPAQADENSDFFERKIRPVLVEHCYECHSSKGDGIEGGLRLDSRDAMRRGGDSGPAVVPEDLSKSLVLSAIKYDGMEMPPDKKLPAAIVKDFEHWIAQGAVDPVRRQSSANPQRLLLQR